MHYHDLFVPRAVDSLCPPVVAPLLVFFMNMLQVLQWPSTARVHLRYCIATNLTGQSAVSYLFSHGGEDWSTGLIDLVPIILWSSLTNHSRRQSKNAVAYARLPNSKRFPTDALANYVYSFPWYQELLFSRKMADFTAQIYLYVTGFRMKLEHLVRFYGSSQYQDSAKSNILNRNAFLFLNEPRIYISKEIALKLWAGFNWCGSLSENSGQALASPFSG